MTPARPAHAPPLLLVLLLGVALLSGCASTGPQPRAERPLSFVPPPTSPPLMGKDNLNAQVPTAADTRPAPDVWTHIARNYRLGFDPDRPRIARERQRYTRHPTYFRKVTERARPYLYHILQVLEAEKLPPELALLPFIESAYIVDARSRSGAAGLWQFIPSTAATFGLAMDHGYDERLDVVASTRAAARYLRHLKEVFDGDWLLALAAYNTGEQNVRRAIERNQARGEPADFWHLDLPAETRDYVPRFLAVLSLVADPEAYQVTPAPVPNRRYFTTFPVRGRISLEKLARYARLDPDELLRLNAAFRHGITPADRTVQLAVPLQAASVIAGLNFSERPPAVVAVNVHRVRKGETLSQISRRYGVPLVKIKASNRLKGDRIRVGQTLTIPGS